MANSLPQARQDTGQFGAAGGDNPLQPQEITQLVTKRDMHIQRERTFRITRHSPG